jgi:4-hydroxy-2-oxoheptanedioate aldolase
MAGTAASGSGAFRENLLLTSWRAGKATLNGWLSIPEPFTAEAMAHGGWDSLTIDMQHGVIAYQQAVQMLIGISTTPTVPLVRVPWLDEGIVMKMLDAGAYGIICPMINTRADAERLARSCRYAPRGIRSFGPIRVRLYAGDEYERRANDTVLAIAMIETRDALDNLEAIVDVPELSGIYIGPADLSLSLGIEPRLDPEEPVVLRAIERIITTTRRAGKRVGIHNGTVAYAERMIALGADFVTVSSDLRLMSAGAEQVVSAFRQRHPA